ncbi:MAG: hypothetical protein SOZ12_08545 [Anaerotignum sp.]|nr:hypothetical protein [Anaerotignum sp.]MDY3927351.1 hypothetical protein [Anaerotignum sp.]
MGKIEEAIKKINADIQEEPEEDVLAKIGEYIIDQIRTEADAEAVLAEGKSLKKIFNEIREEAYKQALEKRKNGKTNRNYEAIGCDGESTLNRVMNYFGLGENPQTPAEAPKKGVCVKLEDFF